MPRRKQLAPKRLKGNIEKGSEGDWKEGENAQDEEEDEDVETSKDEEDKSSDGATEISKSPNASWSFKFTPFGSNTERVMRASSTAGGSGISKVFSKGIWYPDDSKCSTESSNPLGESSHSEGENDKLRRKAARSESHSSKSPEKEKKCERITTRVNSGQSDHEVEDTVQRHSSSSLIRENLRHYFLDKLKSSGKVVKDGDEHSSQRQLQREERVGRTSPERSGSHGTRSNYTHTVLWMPPKVSDKSPNEPSDSGVGTSSKASINHSRGKRSSFLESSKFQERLNLAKEIPSSSSSSHHQGQESHRDEESSRSSPSHSSTPDCTKKSPPRVHEENGDSSVSGASSPSDYYHSYHSAGMAYYQSPFMGYGLYPSYPNFVYPYNYGYVVAVPGGLFIPMGNSHSQTSGMGPTSSLGPHKDAPLDLSACSTTKKEEDVKPDMVKKEEPLPSSSSSVKHQTKRAAGSSKKAKGEKTMVLWKKVPRHAMMMDMAQLSVLEKVHVLYTTESVFLCFICSDCHALFNSLDLLVLHAVGTAHTSRNDLDDHAMELKGFDVIPVDKITKKQKNSDKKPEFSFESPLQSTVSLHRRRLPAGKDFLLKSRDVYKCSVCPETFPNFLRYTMHMNETGHRRKSVRYSDVYKAQRQVKKILKCMNCEKSFMTLEELTMHMIKTKHYSDIAGGFANNAELEEDAEYDHLDPVHENHLDGAEHQSTVHPTLPPSHKSSSHDGNIADGTSSESENTTSLRGSPVEQCRSRSPAVRSKEPEDLLDGEDQMVTEPWKDNDEMVARGFDDSSQRSGELMATENESQYCVAASTSQSYSPPLPGTKRDMRELDGDETDSVSKKVKVESESVAGDEDDYQTFGGYETENEYEDEDEDEFASGDYDMGSFNGSHTRESDQKNCFLTSDLCRKKLRRRIYKHSLLYQCRKNRTEGKKEVSAFDGLYNWAKSLGLLSSAAVTQPTPAAQMPKAVVKCDGKYVDPDNFDVTLPYGGKVRPDVNPLSKLSSMVETTQMKQPNTKSFESNFIMDRAYFNFEKNHRNPSQGAVAINASFQSDSEGGNDSHTLSRTWLNSPTEEEHCSETSSKTLTEHLSKQIQNEKERHEFLNSGKQLPSTSSHSQLQGWPLDGTISKDTVLERLILKAYNRPPRSGFTLRSTSKEQCTCSTKPEIKTSTGDFETRPSKTKPDGQCDTEKDATKVEDPEKCESLLGGDRNVCYKCSGKNRSLESKMEVGLSSDSNTSRQDQRLSEAANTTQRVEGMMDTGNEEGDSDTSVAAEGPDDKLKKKSEERSAETYGNLFFSQDRRSSKSPSQRDIDRGCLQDLIYGPRDSPGVREVKFTWAEAIDTLISRIFEPESVPMEQSISDSVNHDISHKSENKEMTRGREEGEGGGDGHEKETKVSPRNSECKGKVNNDQTKEDWQGGENDRGDRKEKQREGESDKDVDGKQSNEVNSNKESRGKAENGNTVRDDHVHGVRGKKEHRKKVPDMEETTENGCHPDENYSHDNVDETVSCTEKDDRSYEKFKKETTDKSSADNGIDKPDLGDDGSSKEADRSSPEVDDSSEHRNDSPYERFSDARERTSSDVTAYYSDMSSMSRYSGHGFKYSMAKRFFDISMSPSDGPNGLREKTENFSDNPKMHSEDVEETPEEAGRSVERCRDEASNDSDSFCPKSKHMRLPKFYKEKHHLPRYFHYNGPPPLIPSADASTKAIQRLEELTRKPSVTNVKEMILNKIQEEVERLTAPDYENSQVSFHMPPRPSYLLPCVGNNNDGDASGKSLKSLEELSKCSPLSPFQRMPMDTRLMVSKDAPTYRHDVGLKYLPPSATPESNVSVIQSLEKLSNEHPVLRRKEQPVSQPHPPSLRETPLSAPEKLQYLPPSFGTEASNVNSILSLERFSSQHPFFSISEGQAHSSLSSCPVVSGRIKEESVDDSCLSEKLSQSNKSSSNAIPVDFSIKPKEHPVQLMVFKVAGSSCGSEGGVVIKVEPEDVESEQFESTSSKSKENRKLADDDNDCDKLQGASPSSKKEDPLLALDNLVRMKQSKEASPSPSKIALELVNKDMKSPLYILPPDEVSSQSVKNPLEEMNKMVKFT